MSPSPPRSTAPGIDYTYGVDVGGKVASVGGRMIKRAAQMVIGQFFERLAGVASGDAGSRGTDGAKRPRSWFAKLFGGKQ